MNREILFKAKRLDNGEWVEGYYLNVAKINHFICTGKIKLDGAVKGIIAPEMYAIDPDTICQYTELTDKNGNKIWENDICDRKEKYPEIVTYNEGDWQLDYSYELGKEMHYAACNLGFYACERNCVEVIGNIFDNPELLEVEQVKRYKCIKSFCVDNYDGNGFLIENSSTVIEEGKVYELDEGGRMMIGGKDHVHLDAVDDGSWLEITKESLEEYFDLLEVE